jgi:acyl dehydratase
MHMREFESSADLVPLIGTEVAVSEWVTIDQRVIDLFADATDDHQWIHVDPARAADSPFGSTVAHGFLTLSLLPKFLAASVRFKRSVMGLNYGLNKVRFTAPVPVDSRLRARFHLIDAEPIESNGMQITWQMTVERAGSLKPVCVAESVVRDYTG